MGSPPRGQGPTPVLARRRHLPDHRGATPVRAPARTRVSRRSRRHPDRTHRGLLTRRHCAVLARQAPERGGAGRFPVLLQPAASAAARAAAGRSSRAALGVAQPVLLPHAKNENGDCAKWVLRLVPQRQLVAYRHAAEVSPIRVDVSTAVDEEPRFAGDRQDRRVGSAGLGCDRWYVCPMSRARTSKGSGSPTCITSSPR